jgi:hypothetical protein
MLEKHQVNYIDTYNKAKLSLAVSIVEVFFACYCNAFGIPRIIEFSLKKLRLSL